MADWHFVQNLMRVALRSGATRSSLTQVDWDVSGRCQSPQTRAIEARPYAGKSGTGLAVIMTVRCRRCDSCRRLRQSIWTARAKSECASATRTWFGTLTLRPESQHYFLTKARKYAQDRSLGDFDTLPYWEQFSLRHNAISPELTKYLKRVRKYSDAPIRFLLVAEAHKSGAPHYHMLLHERDADKPVRHALLVDQWNLGFSKWKLAPESSSASTYLCKYLSKSTAARVRASVRYGQIEDLTTNALGLREGRHSLHV